MSLSMMTRLKADVSLDAEKRSTMKETLFQVLPWCKRPEPLMHELPRDLSALNLLLQNITNESQALAAASDPGVAKVTGQKVHELLQALRALCDKDERSGSVLLEAALAVANGETELLRSSDPEHLALALAKAAGRVPRADLRLLATTLISARVRVPRNCIACQGRHFCRRFAADC